MQQALELGFDHKDLLSLSSSQLKNAKNSADQDKFVFQNKLEDENQVFEDLDPMLQLNYNNRDDSYSPFMGPTPTAGDFSGHSSAKNQKMLMKYI